MKFLSFILIYPLIWLLSLLPFKVLYLLSDLIYVILYHVVGYRKKVVYGNLKIAFPEKSEKERKAIAKKFYAHFVDVFIEMIKSFTISKKEISKRYVCTNVKVLQELEKKDKSIILLGAHYANWEWMFSLNMQVASKGIGVYKKVKNPYFDKKVRQTRGRYNTTLVPTKEISGIIQDNYDNGIHAIYGLIGDQTPRPKKLHYWSEYFGVRVPIHTGAEILAKKYDFAMVFFSVTKVKRGYYEIGLKIASENAREIEDYKLTDFFLRETEKHIKNAPEYYLWTHKRFKHAGKEQEIS